MTALARTATSDIEQALLQVETAVRGDGNEQDFAYFIEHRSRYLRTLQRIRDLCPPGARVLNVGSHFLHLSAALPLLSFESAGIDVAAFADQPLVRRRADAFKVENHVVDQLSHGDFLPGRHDAFDLVVFTEILEHVTFNPIRFWQRTYELLEPGGMIYITTPNSLTPWRILRALKRITLLRGIGLSMNEIMYTVTYGHHWKEYSGAEISEYFALMTPDFAVRLSYYNLPQAQRPASGSRSFKGMIRAVVHRASDMVPAFRDQIEAVVVVKSKSGWRLQSPSFL